MAVAVLAITFMLLFVARLATSYDQYPATSVHLDLDSQDESIENPTAIFHEPDPPLAAGQVTSTSKTTAHSSDKIAVILESRPLPHLLPLLLHFSTVLGPDWPIHVFTSPTTKSKLLKPPSLKRLVTAGKIKFADLPIGLPPDFSFHEPFFRTEFMTRFGFWESLKPAEHVLLFSADSMLCSQSPRTVDGFLQYDFIGAPLSINGTEGMPGVSGGLSLRNRQAMLDITSKMDWSGERDPSGAIPQVWEDIWFWDMLKKFGKGPVDGSERAVLPNLEAARGFAVGALWGDNHPMGYDGALKKYESKKWEMFEWCPEYALLATVSEGEAIEPPSDYYTDFPPPPETPNPLNKVGGDGVVPDA
jgi:hypothetical protein